MLDKIIDMCCSHDATAGVMKTFAKKKFGGKDDEETLEVTDHKPVNGKVSPVPVKASHTTPVPASKKFTDFDAKYLPVEFKKLPAKVKKAAEAVGFDQELWQNGGWPECAHKAFEDLTASEKEALQTLGWDEPSWDNKYEHHGWADLPTKVQNAAIAAGFEQKVWDNDEWPSSLNVDYDELSADMRRCMNVLGWSKWTWE